MEVKDFAQSISEALQPRRVPPGFVAPVRDLVQPLSLPPWFIDRCRKAYLSVRFDDPGGPRVIGITSALHGEGKTSVAVGVALAIAADTQESTVLLECDLERPSFFRIFSLEPEGGLSDWLGGRGQLRVARTVFLPNAYIIPAGSPQVDPARLFYQLTESNVVPELRQRFRNVVIDLPPMLDIAYSTLAQRLVDRILVVARWGVTPVDDLEKVIFLLGRERVSGIVLNGTDYRTPEWLRRQL